MNDKIKVLVIIYYWFMSFGEEYGFVHSVVSSFIKRKIDDHIVGEDTSIYLGNFPERLINYRSYDGETFFSERDLDA